MAVGKATKREATAKAWVNAGKVKSQEEYYALTKGTSAEAQFVVDPMEHSHDGVSHSHDGGDVEHTHDMPIDQMIVEEKPKRRRTRRKK